MPLATFTQNRPAPASANYPHDPNPVPASTADADSLPAPDHQYTSDPSTAEEGGQPGRPSRGSKRWGKIMRGQDRAANTFVAFWANVPRGVVAVTIMWWCWRGDVDIFS